MLLKSPILFLLSILLYWSYYQGCGDMKYIVIWPLFLLCIKESNSAILLIVCPLSHTDLQCCIHLHSAVSLSFPYLRDWWDEKRLNEGAQPQLYTLHSPDLYLLITSRYRLAVCPIGKGEVSSEASPLILLKNPGERETKNYQTIHTSGLHLRPGGLLQLRKCVNLTYLVHECKLIQKGKQHMWRDTFWLKKHATNVIIHRSQLLMKFRDNSKI